MPISEVFNMDFINFTQDISDKFYGLSICDFPYGINASKMQMGTGKNKKYKKDNWDNVILSNLHISEVLRVSNKVIFFGGNFYDLPKTNGWIFWDKLLNKDISFSDGELAWTNFLTSITKVTYQYSGFLGADKERIHITQKPIQLYSLLLKKYAKEGDKIFDPTMGSQSSRIAAYDCGFDYYGCELDGDYFNEGCKRFENHIKQQKLF